MVDRIDDSFEGPSRLAVLIRALLVSVAALLSVPPAFGQTSAPATTLTQFVDSVNSVTYNVGSLAEAQDAAVRVWKSRNSSLASCAVITFEPAGTAGHTSFMRLNGGCTCNGCGNYIHASQGFCADNTFTSSYFGNPTFAVMCNAQNSVNQPRAKNNASCPGNCPVGNPTNPANGNKMERQVLYRGPGGFELTLTFNSFDTSAVRFDRHWRDSFDRQVQPNGTTAIVFRPDGKALRFTQSGGVWITDADTADRLVELQNPPGTRTGWQFITAAADEVETYDAAGTKLLSIQARSGLTQTLVYSDGTGGANGGFVLDANGNPTATPLPSGLLIRVADPYGRVLAFGYNSVSHVVKLTDPAGGVYRFAHDTANTLVSITFPDSTTRTYAYNEPAYTGGANLPSALTGITDENGSRFATFQYDAQQRAVSTEHAGGVFKYTLSYATDAATVTSPLGALRQYAFTTLFDVHKTTAVTGDVCPECGPGAQTFDVNGNIASSTDWNGNRTNYSYDLARNLETSRTEGLASDGTPTAQTRTITTAWDANFRLPAQIAEPLRITTNVYDADGAQCGARGALCSRTIQATTDTNGSLGFSATASGTPRSWTYTYNANGSVLTVNGPRTDVSDVTTYTYYANDDADLGKRGNVATITNAAGHVTSITAYNAHGQPLTIVDANGMTTTLTYDARLRLRSRNAGGEVTSYDYDNVGQLTKVTLPEGSYVSYTYDAAHRLTGMADNLGNSITYTLDAMGNRTHEDVRNPANNLSQTRSRVYNNLNRLFQEVGAQNQTTQYAYDNQGNVLSVTDPLNHVTSNQYDALNRLKQVTDPALGVTQYGYNGLDALTQVTDPRNLVTGYTVDGLGNLAAQSSPDTGNTTNTYDAAGNLLTQTDAKGQTTTYAYDALNRISLITFHDGSKQAYVYDQNANGIGRLSSITETDPANNVTSQIAYAYDLHGRVTSETRTLAGQSYVTSYAYDTFGRMTGMTYPDGRVVAYTLDALGRISQIDTTKDNQTQTIVSGVAYQPFGGVKSYTLGNGHVYTRSYDQDGRIASYTLGDKTFAIGYDAASRIEFISDTAVPANSNTYGYDALDRLTSATTPTTPYSYSYDAVGNRLSKTVGAGSDTYAYSSTSNRIASITPASGPPRSFVFDPNGSTTADGNNTYAYDTRGRMVQATSSLGTTTYQVNALGQRVRKTNTSGDTVFHYDTRGHLIAETDPGGGVKREIFYLGDIPVGVVQ